MYTSLLYLPSLEDASAEAARKISVAVAKRYIPAKLYCRHDGEFVRACGARQGLSPTDALERLWTLPAGQGDGPRVDALPPLPLVRVDNVERPALYAHELHETVLQALVSYVKEGAPAGSPLLHWRFDPEVSRLLYYKGLTLWRKGWDSGRNVIARATASVGWGIKEGQWSDIAVHVDESDGSHAVEMLKLLAVFNVATSDAALLPDIVGEPNEGGFFNALYIFAIKYNKPLSWPKGVAPAKAVPSMVRQTLKASFCVRPVSHIAGTPIVQPHFQASGEPPLAAQRAFSTSALAASESSTLATDGIMYCTHDLDRFSRAPPCPCDDCKRLAGRAAPPPWHVTQNTGRV